MTVNPDKRQIFSFRKLKSYGMSSALLGMALVSGKGVVVSADEQDPSSDVAITAQSSEQLLSQEQDHLVVTRAEEALSEEVISPVLSIESPEVEGAFSAISEDIEAEPTQETQPQEVVADPEASLSLALSAPLSLHTASTASATVLAEASGLYSIDGQLTKVKVLGTAPLLTLSGQNTYVLNYVDTGLSLGPQATGSWGGAQPANLPERPKLQGSKPSIEGLTVADGKYVINGQATTILATGGTPYVLISASGTYLINYVDTGIKAEGKGEIKPLAQPLVAPPQAAAVKPSSVPSGIRRDATGFYSVNGVLTKVRVTGTREPLVSTSATGTYVINYVDTGIKVSDTATAPQPSLNWQALTDLMSRQFEASDYSPLTWQAYAGTLTEAKALLTSPTANQAAIDQMVRSLLLGQANLGTDTGPLASAIAKPYQPSDFSAESWTLYQEALTTAKQVLADKRAKQSQLDQALKTLTAAQAQLGARADLLREALEASYLETDYSRASWSAYLEARQSARTLLSGSPTQSEIDDALSRLRGAVASLTVDRSALTAETDLSDRLDARDYSAFSWQSYATKLAEAREILALDRVKQSELDHQVNLLSLARQGLTTDKSQLASALALAFVETHYSPESWAKYQQALSSARLILEDQTAKQYQIQETEAQLRQAIAALTVDKQGLLAELAKAEVLSARDYSETSWQRYTTALSAAQALNRLDRPTQSDLTNTVVALMTAREALQTDDTALMQALARAEALPADPYTAASFAQLTRLIGQLQTLDKAQAKQWELNQAVSTLETAMGQLQRLKAKPLLTWQPLATEQETARLAFHLADPDGAYRRTRVSVYRGEELIDTLAVSNLAETLWTVPETDRTYRLVANMIYDQGDGERETNIGEQTIELAIKRLELKDISQATLYRKASSSGQGPVLALETLPEQLDDYYVKVDSHRFKQVQLKVKTIVPEVVDGQEVYKVTASMPELSQDQDQDGRYEEGYSFYVAKKAVATEAKQISSFKQLIDEINKNPAGQFVLISDLSAEESDLSSAQPSYLTGVFTGQLTGRHNGKQYAIYGLKAALFDHLQEAVVSHLDLKGVDIRLQNHLVGALARQTTSATVTDVAVEGKIAVAYAAGLYDFKTETDIDATVRVGGLVGSSTTSRFDNVSFDGALTVNTEGVRYKKKNPTDGFYYYHYVTQQTGGILGQSLKDVSVKNARVSADIAVSAANDHTNATYVIAGGIIGNHHNTTTTEEVTNLYAEGSLVNKTASKAAIGGLVGQAFNGKFSNLVTGMAVTGGNLFVGSGKHIWQRFQTPSVFAIDGLAKGNDDSWGSYQSRAVTDALLSKMALTATTADSHSRLATAHQTLYDKVSGYQAAFAKAYQNVELLLPFYNKEYIVKLGNTLKEGMALATKTLLSVTPLSDKAVVSDVSGAEHRINQILLNYEDGTVETLPVSYLGEFKRTGIAEYAIADTALLYTPDQIMRSYEEIVRAVLPELSQMTYLSDDLWTELSGVGDRNEQLEKLYLKDSFNRIQANLEPILRNVLGTSTVYGDTSDVADYILKNKAALMLGLSYISRWYAIDFGDTNIQNIALFQQDFFGKPVETLEWLISVGSSGYQALNPLHNDLANSHLMGDNSDTSNLKDYLEAFRRRFAKDMTASAWFYNASKAHIVEAPTVVDGQVIGSTDTYDKLFKQYTKDAATYDYSHMILPLLTVSEDTVYLITTMEGFEFGSHESYINQALKTSDPNRYAERVKAFEETVAKEAQKRAEHWANWYRIANADVRDKLQTGLPTWDNFMSFSKSWSTAYGEAALRSVNEFFGPIGAYIPRPTGTVSSAEAYSDGSTIRFVLLNALDTTNNRGGSVWTHEQVHNWDNSVYLAGHGRRPGLGIELFAEGLLQSPRSDGNRLSDTLGLNLYGDLTDSALSSFNSSPDRLKSQEDLKTYMHGVMDALYVLDYAQAMSIRDLSRDDQRHVLNKLTVVDRDATRQYDSFRPYTDAEWQTIQLDTIEDFISHGATVKLNHYRSGMGGHGDQGQFSLDYLKVNLFSPFYSLNQNANGVSGGYTIRRAAFELLADLGYEAFVAYLSDQYQAQAQADGVTFGDDYILDKLFAGRYEDFKAFKLAKFEERIAKLPRLQPVSFVWRNQTYKVSSYEELKRLMDQALALDLPQARVGQMATTKASYSLKKAIFEAYLKQTDNFRSSIFN